MTNQENLISGEWETTRQFGRLPLKSGGLECLHQSLPKLEPILEAIYFSYYSNNPPPHPLPLPTPKSQTNFVTIQLKPFYTELEVALTFCCLLLLLLMLLLFCFLKLSFYNPPHS